MTANGSTNTSMIKSRFLSKPEDIGVVAVGFSGGQVSFCLPQAVTPRPTQF